jgi:hypothetical protein
LALPGLDELRISFHDAFAEQGRGPNRRNVNHVGLDDREIDGPREPDRFGKPGFCASLGLGRSAHGGVYDDAELGRRLASRFGHRCILRRGSAGGGTLLIRLEQLYLHRRHHRRDRVFVDQLGVSIPSEQYRELIEPSNDPLEFDTVDEKDRHRCLVLPDVIEKHVLHIL